MSFKTGFYNFRSYVIDTTSTLIENTPDWQKALIIVSLAIFIIGLICTVLAITVCAPGSAGAVVLGIIGSRCLEIGAAGLISGFMGLGITAYLNRKKVKMREEVIQQATIKAPAPNINSAKDEPIKA